MAYPETSAPSTATRDGQAFKKDVQGIGQGLKDAKDDLSAVVSGIGDAARSGAAAAKEGVRQTVDAVKEQSIAAAETLEDRIAERPFTAIGIALGAGVLIGMLLRRSRE